MPRLRVLKRLSFRILADAECDRKTYTNNMDGDANHHHLYRKGISPGARQRHNDAVHEEVDRRSIEYAGNHRVRDQERESSAKYKICSGG